MSSATTTTPHTHTDQPCLTCGAAAVPDSGYCRRCGYARIPRPDLDPAANPTAAARALLPPRPPTTALLVIGAVVALFLATTAPVLLVRAIFFGPDDTVRSYFNALTDRDADAAWRLLAPDDHDRRPALVGGSVLRDPGYRPPERLTIDGVESRGASAVVTAVVSVDGSRQVVTLELVRGGAGSGVFRRWHIRDGLLPLPLYSDGQEGGLVVAGVRVVVSEDTWMVFPGAYEVTLPDDPLVEISPTTVVAGASDDVVVQPTIRADVHEQVERQVRAYVDGCASQEDQSPDGCPFAETWYELTDVTWEVIRYPSLDMTRQDGRVHVSGDGGLVRVSGRDSFDLPYDNDYSFVVEGEAVPAGDGVSFLPYDYD
jgi:ribosomal protein L40E